MSLRFPPGAAVPSYRAPARSRGAAEPSCRASARSRGAAAALTVAALLSACGEGASERALGHKPRARVSDLTARRDITSGREIAVTSPAARTRPLLRFAAIGDLGPGGAAQHGVAHRMCRWRRNHPFDLVVTTGDNVYPSGERSEFREAFFQPYHCLLARGVRFHATLGNHDIGTRNGRPELRERAFGMKARNYVVRRNGVRLVFVNSNNLRRRWLRRALRGRGDRWKIVMFHHPVYSPGIEHGSTPGFRRKLNPLFRRRGVDLVLNGHDHLFAVTKPIRRIRYVVTGGGGRGLYHCGRAWFSRRCVERHHFIYVRVGRRRITVKAVPRRGRVFHSFSTPGRS